MSNRQIYFLISLATVALVGLIILQVNLIERAIKINEENFHTTVNQVLQEVVKKIQTTEMREGVLKVTRDLNIDLQEDIFFDSENYTRRNERVLVQFREVGGADEDSKTRTVAINDSLKEYIRIEDMDSTRITSVNNASISIQGSEVLEADATTYQWEVKPQMLQVFQQTMQGLSSLGVPLNQRLDSLMVDSLIHQRLHAHGLDMDVNFLIRDQGKNILQSGDISESNFLDSPHQTSLFPGYDLAGDKLLILYFPNQRAYTLRSIGLVALAALVFTCIILVTFYITIKVIFRQKNLSEIKNDFINNMTHELKTPLATISLAADALSNPMIQEKKEGMGRYLSIIKEENQRMNRQVERVLQAAQFRKNEYVWKKKPIDVHDMLQESVQKTLLKVQQKGGEIVADLNAEKTLVEADPVHLSNTLINLLDNANKYSPETPEIRVSTYNKQNKLYLSVADKGIGISKQDQSRIFDRFYRVSKGDLHESKGFGLGLSYVKEVVLAHEGTIQVHSKLGRGSIFTICLPLLAESGGE
ncbi:MAG: HAMP domain-containing sensor histidine kinase [Bacteroidota bacterium]